MLKIPKQYKSLEFIRTISWPDIFAIWKQGEVNQESWKKHWEERGFKSWDEWREAYAAPLDPKNLSWSLYKINNPIEDLPNFYGTPTRGWVDKAYSGKTTMLLKNLVTLPIITENDKVADMKKSFPKATMLTGLIHDGNIILIEGQHRACALASWNPNIPLNSEVTLALAEWTKDIPVLGGNYKNK
jgi:hypothetical protein